LVLWVLTSMCGARRGGPPSRWDHRSPGAGPRGVFLSPIHTPPCGPEQPRHSVRRAGRGRDSKCRERSRPARDSLIIGRRRTTLGDLWPGPRGLRRGPTTMRYRAYAHTDEADRSRTLEEDVRRGLTESPKSLPPKYFYDAIGAKLFEDITRVPEYYLTRTEAALLETLAPRLMRELDPRDIVELGAGTALKTRRFLDARNGLPGTVRYVPVDVDEPTLQATAARLVADYPDLQVGALVGDFERHLSHVPPPVSRRLVLFLGSTIGNLEPSSRHRFLLEVRALLRDREDRFLVGLDLVKDVKLLEAAYNDASGVTAE